MDLLNTAANLTHRLYNKYLDSLPYSEPKVQSWPLVKSPVPLFTMIGLYYLMAIFGPRYMKNQKPFNLKWIIVFYNLGLSLLSVWMWVKLLYLAIKMGYTFQCQPYRYIQTEDEHLMAIVIWWYYFSKFLEFGDTLFFILRKKNSQLTILHVYHHSTMPIYCWAIAKWAPGGMYFIPASLNSFVHIAMYGYYFLSSLGPQMQKYLWWKKYITLLQLVQFFIGCSTGCLMLIDYPVKCEYSYPVRVTIVVYTASFIILFINFYFHAYIKKTCSGRTAKAIPDRNGTHHTTNGAAVQDNATAGVIRSRKKTA